MWGGERTLLLDQQGVNKSISNPQIAQNIKSGNLCNLWIETTAKITRSQQS